MLSARVTDDHDVAVCLPGAERIVWRAADRPDYVLALWHERGKVVLLALQAHHKEIRELHLRALFANDATRGERLTAEAASIYLDYSKHGAALAALDPTERAAKRKELLEQWEGDTLPYGAAARHLVDEIIEPVQTRDVVIQFLNAWQSRGAIGEHYLANWPTKF